MSIVKIVVPVYNEESQLINTCNKLTTLLEVFHEEIKIIVINDGSTDTSANILRHKLPVDLNSIQVIHLKENKGLNFIERSFVNKIDEEFILFIPADNRFSLESLRSFITFILENRKKYRIFQATPHGKMRGIFRELISITVAKLTYVQFLNFQKIENLGLVCMKKEYYNCYPNLPFRWGGTIFYRSMIAANYSHVAFVPIRQESDESFNNSLVISMLKRLPSAIAAIVIFPAVIYLKVRKIEKN